MADDLDADDELEMAMAQAEAELAMLRAENREMMIAIAAAHHAKQSANTVPLLESCKVTGDIVTLIDANGDHLATYQVDTSGDEPSVTRLSDE